MVCLTTGVDFVVGNGTLGPVAAFAMPVALTIVVTRVQMSVMVESRDLGRRRVTGRMNPPGSGRWGARWRAPGVVVVRPISPEAPGTTA